MDGPGLGKTPRPLPAMDVYRSTVLDHRFEQTAVPSFRRTSGTQTRGLQPSTVLCAFDISSVTKYCIESATQIQFRKTKVGRHSKLLTAQHRKGELRRQVPIHTDNYLHVGQGATCAGSDVDYGPETCEGDLKLSRRGQHRSCQELMDLSPGEETARYALVLR